MRNPVLDRRYVLKNDRTRIMCVARRIKGSPGEVTFLHPSVGIVLSLLDGKRSMEDIYDSCSRLFGLSSAEAVSLTDEVTARHRNLIVDAGEQRSDLNPINMVISSEDVDLDKYRCERPVQVVCTLTWRCHRSCRYCYSGGSPRVGELSSDGWSQVFQQMAALGTTSTQFTGGEFFCRADWRQLLATCLDQGIMPLISTKHFLSESDADFLVETGLDELQVSLDSDDPAECEYLTGCPEYLPRMVASVSHLVSRGMRVIGHIVATPINLSRAQDTIRMLEALGVREISVATCSASLYRDSSSLILDERQKGLLRDLVMGYGGRIRPALVAPPDPFFLSPDERRDRFFMRASCAAGRQSLVILPDGTVVPCESLPSCLFSVGNIRTDTLASIWSSEALASFVQRPRPSDESNPCTRCADFEGCQRTGHCYKRALMAFCDPQYPDPLCPRAPMGRRTG